jgi:hypothetical protein
MYLASQLVHVVNFKKKWLQGRAVIHRAASY